MRSGGSPPRGKGQGDKPIRGGWGVWKGLFILAGFAASVFALFSFAGAPVPDLGLDWILNKFVLVFAVLAGIALLAFFVWFARAILYPETDLL